MFNHFNYKMGIYYNTYLCYGDFKEKIYTKKTLLQSMDSIIENHEWEQGYVDLKDVEKLTTIEAHDDQNLFLLQVCTSTYDFPIIEDKKYIIVK